MNLWHQKNVDIAQLSPTMNQLEVDGWEIYQVIPHSYGRVTVLVRKQADRERIEAAARTEPGWVVRARAALCKGAAGEAVKLVQQNARMSLTEAVDYVENQL